MRAEYMPQMMPCTHGNEKQRYIFQALFTCTADVERRHLDVARRNARKLFIREVYGEFEDHLLELRHLILGGVNVDTIDKILEKWDEIMDLVCECPDPSVNPDWLEKSHPGENPPVRGPVGMPGGG
jgi:hypothetical protein